MRMYVYLVSGKVVICTENALTNEHNIVSILSYIWLGIFGNNMTLVVEVAKLSCSVSLGVPGEGSGGSEADLWPSRG